MTEPAAVIDVRDTKCPLNFVKARLALEKLAVGEVLEVWIRAESESTLNIPKSMTQEGHEVVSVETEDDIQKISVRRAR